MKKIMMALMITGLAYGSAQAQVTRVCRKSSNNDISCYKTKYAQNFPVCKDDLGYSICGESRNYKNSTTAPQQAVATNYDNTGFESTQQWEGYREKETAQSMAPQSQSYATYEENATVPYMSYDDGKSKQKFCYGGDNVAELNKNPYKACPSPQSDGPEKAKERGWRN